MDSHSTLLRNVAGPPQPSLTSDVDAPLLNRKYYLNCWYVAYFHACTMIYHTHELSVVVRVCATVGMHHRELSVTDVLQSN